MALRVLVSAGEASGDLYASALVARWSSLQPDTEFFGCAGPRMRAAGVEPVVRSESLSVVGLVEVLAHIPRIYGEFRKLCRASFKLAQLRRQPKIPLPIRRWSSWR